MMIIDIYCFETQCSLFGLHNSHLSHYILYGAGERFHFNEISGMWYMIHKLNRYILNWNSSDLDPKRDMHHKLVIIKSIYLMTNDHA